MLTFDNLNLMTDKLEGNVTVNHWARTRRQKILRDTSFESETFNIYNPIFSSDEESKQTENFKNSPIKECDIL